MPIPPCTAPGSRRGTRRLEFLINARKRHHPRRARHRSGRLVRRLPDGAPLDSTAPRTRCRTAPDSPAPAGAPRPPPGREPGANPTAVPAAGAAARPLPTDRRRLQSHMPDDDREQPAGSRRNRRTRPAGHDPQTRPDCDDRIEHTAADQHLWEALNRARARTTPPGSRRRRGRWPGPWPGHPDSGSARGRTGRGSRPGPGGTGLKPDGSGFQAHIPRCHRIPTQPHPRPPEPSCMGRGHPPGGRHTTGSGVVSR